MLRFLPDPILLVVVSYLGNARFSSKVGRATTWSMKQVNSVPPLLLSSLRLVVLEAVGATGAGGR